MKLRIEAYNLLVLNYQKVWGYFNLVSQKTMRLQGCVLQVYGPI